MPASSERQFRALLARFVTTYEAVSAAAENTPDDDLAYERAKDLLAACEGSVGATARLKARIAARMWRAGHLTLAQLAQRLGVSKSRADDLIRAAREQDR